MAELSRTCEVLLQGWRKFLEEPSPVFIKTMQ